LGDAGRETVEVCTGFWRENERKRPLEKPRREWVDHIKMDIQEVVWKGTDWNDLPQDRKWSRAVVFTNGHRNTVPCN